MSSNPTLATAGFRLSSQQEQSWLAQERGMPQFAQAVVEIEGQLDVERLKSALQSVVAKYEILRTVLRRQSGVRLPFQVIHEEAVFSFVQADHGSSLDEQLGMERSSLAGIEQGPALRAVLVSVANERHTLVLSLPAFCADVATLENLSAELSKAYGADTAGSEEVMQYADLVEWQNELLSSEESKPGRDFWRQATRSIDFVSLASLNLPLEKKTESPFAWTSFGTAGSESVVSQAARQLNVSSEVLLLTAWNALLSRLLGSAEVVTGCEFDGRRYDELAKALGPLARTLPLRIEMSPVTSFKELLQSVIAATNDARNWQESFAWGQATEVENPFLPLAFSYSDLGQAQEAGGVRFGLERAEVVSERFKLKLKAVKRGSELTLEFHYDAARLEGSAVERIAGYYQNLLTAALANPATAVARLPLLNEAERRQLLVEWNQTAASYPTDQCLQELFEAQAARTPDRIAVRCGKETLSYGELNQRANQLAHYLRKQGVGPDRRVGLCVERSTAMMVAVLGILKAGGGFVPLNADNPAIRTKQQLEGAVALITEAKFVANLPELGGEIGGQECPPHTIVLGRDEKLWADEPQSNPAVNTTPENLVYVIFTSGSTGVPKGVAVRHQNLVNYADFITKKLHLSDHPEGLQFATVSTLGADLGNTCIYPSLISGGTLQVIPHEAATDPQQFAAHASQYAIDVLKIVPSHLSALLQSEEAAKILPRKYLITGGEALTAKLLEKIASLHPACEILNHYGPTETTVGSLTLEVKHYDWKNSQLATLPIGKPIQNTQVYVLDQKLEPVPVGVAGELYIAGAGVTAGYLNQPEKTAERFLQNPFSGDPNAKMYRTGDLARYGEDGNIEFLGRGDDQVKIRGFRIELGEIEAVLGQHPGVKQGVVLARASASDPNDKRLLAYAVLQATATNGHGAVTGKQLRHHLQQHLPEYMVPQAVLVLAKLPLNANGKLDRQALPEPEQAMAQKAYIAPRTATERVIVETWAEVLRRDPSSISAEDNFFDLGGHSLLATQVVSRLRRALNIELPLRTLFESPTVVSLAGQADKLSTSNQPGIPSIVRVSRDKPLPLSFAQQRLWVLDHIEPNNPLYNIPRAILLKGDLNAKAFIEALNEIVRRHESQRTTFATGKDGQPVQVIAERLVLNVPVEDLTSLPASEREATARNIAAEDTRTPFNLSTGPLLRAKILKLADREHVLLLTMHHIVSDAWSSAIFFRELGDIYTAFIEGKPSPLPELTIQYADYAAWQRNFLQGRTLENQLSYWREHLRGAPPLLQLPTDRQRPEARKFHGAYEPIALAHDVAAGVKTFSAEHGVTAFMTMLAAFSTLLFRYSGEEHIVLGTDIANRTTPETERLIGFFINLLPMHTDLSGDPKFKELVLRVRETALGAYAHQDIPFDKLVEDLRPERTLSHNPIVQSLFVMQNIPAQRRSLAGLDLSAFSVPITRSKFDVAVFIRENVSGTFQDWLYSTELFERSTILRLASNFEHVLRHGITQPEARLSELDLHSSEEKRRIEEEKTGRKLAQRKKLQAAQPRAVALLTFENKS